MQRHKRCGFNSWVRNILWRRKWQPTPVFLPGESHGQRSLVGYSPWGHKGSDMTEWLSIAQNRSRKVNPKLTSAGIEPEKEVGTRTGAYYIHKLTWEIERDHFNCPWGRKARWIMGDALGRKRGKTWLGGVSSSFLFKHREKAWAPGLTSDCLMTGQLGNHLCAPTQVSGSWCRCWSPAWIAFGWSPVFFCASGVTGRCSLCLGLLALGKRVGGGGGFFFLADCSKLPAGPPPSSTPCGEQGRRCNIFNVFLVSPEGQASVWRAPINQENHFSSFSFSSSFPSLFLSPAPHPFFFWVSWGHSLGLEIGRYRLIGTLVTWAATSVLFRVRRLPFAYWC